MNDNLNDPRFIVAFCEELVESAMAGEFLRELEESLLSCSDIEARRAVDLCLGASGECVEHVCAVARERTSSFSSDLGVRVVALKVALFEMLRR